MILDRLDNFKRYVSMHPHFERAFEYLRTTDFKSMVNGRYPIIDDELFALVEKREGRDRSEAKLESHRKYIDIQLVIYGDEEMGYRLTADCKEPIDSYSPEKDILFYNDPVLNWIKTPSGFFCIFFPEDAHAPVVGKGERFKVVVKVASLIV